MATSGLSNQEEDNRLENGTNWPLKYVPEAKEHICGWCGQLLLSDDRNTQNIEVFEEIQKMNQKFELLSADVTEMKKTEEKLMEELENNKKEFHKVILDLKTEIKKDLDIKCGESRVAVLSTVFKKVNALEEKMREMGVAQDIKMAEVNGRVSGMAEAISVFVRKEMEDKKTEFKKELEKVKLGGSTNDGAVSTVVEKVHALEEGMEEKMAEVNVRVSGMTEAISTVVQSTVEDRMKKETEALWVKLKESEEENKTAKTQLEQEVEQLKTKTEFFSDRIQSNGQDLQLIKSQLEDEIARLKTKTDTFSEQLETNDRQLQAIKIQVEDEPAKKELVNKNSFHVEPSALHQLAIPMNCFNLVAHNYLFQPSFRWTIDGIEAKMAQKTYELSSEVFQWNSHPVQARAKLQLKKNGHVHLSLCLEDVSETVVKNFTLIPYVFYLLKDKYARFPKHKCTSISYLTSSTFDSSLAFGLSFVHKSWFHKSTYKVADSVEIEIYVEPSAMTQLVHSYDGTLEWSMENYAKRLQLEKDGLVPCQDSPYFYTGPNGYRVQMKIYLNGNGGKGVTARILFLTGKFEDELPESFPHSTTVTLVNRKEPEKSISKTVEEDIENKQHYTLEICKLEEVENFIENDTLFCKVVVQSH